MAKDATAPASTNKRPGAKEVNRGTQDELEIIMQILEKNLSVRQAVLEKIRAVKYRKGLDKKPENAADATAKKPK